MSSSVLQARESSTAVNQPPCGHVTQVCTISASHLSRHSQVKLREMQVTQFAQSPAGILHTEAGGRRPP